MCARDVLLAWLHGKLDHGPEGGGRRNFGRLGGHCRQREQTLVWVVSAVQMPKFTPINVSLNQTDTLKLCLQVVGFPVRT